ncbi:hypothetical protein JOD54_001795 [Actinokineospora baliensis]|uniref:hypothetical protein n=1 Tax=Actinokineospora baliensis TaxID=547056 RepID=UPI00195BEF3A|nr:hypothetical protein [Actinokineospora baliensis]MBM7771591.1 hypothetical protein [Actinokineospora baliensis]
MTVLVLTNKSIYDPGDLRPLAAHRPRRAGKRHASHSHPRARRAAGTAYIIRKAGVTPALHEVGHVPTDRAPDRVALGETRTYPHRPTRVIGSVADLVGRTADPFPEL